MNRKHLTFFVAGITALALLAGCGSKTEVPATPSSQAPTAKTEAKKTNYPITLKDSEGRDVTFNAEPKRVISAVPSNTELLFAFNKGSVIIGTSGFDDYPEAAKAIKEKVNFFPPNYEQIVALKPDVILMPQGMKEIKEKLTKDYKISVFTVQPNGFDDLYAITKTLGVALNGQEDAEKLVSSMKQEVTGVTEKVAKATSKPKVYLESNKDDKGSWTAGSGTFQDALVTMAGGVNIAAADVKGDWQPYSLEKLIAQNPEIVFTSKKEAPVVKDRKGWEGIKAVKDGKVLAIEDGNLIARPGPRLVEGLKWMAKTIHPELFK